MRDRKTRSDDEEDDDDDDEDEEEMPLPDDLAFSSALAVLLADERDSSPSRRTYAGSILTAGPLIKAIAEDDERCDDEEDAAAAASSDRHTASTNDAPSSLIPSSRELRAEAPYAERRGRWGDSIAIPSTPSSPSSSLAVYDRRLRRLRLQHLPMTSDTAETHNLRTSGSSSTAHALPRAGSRVGR